MLRLRRSRQGGERVWSEGVRRRLAGWWRLGLRPRVDGVICLWPRRRKRKWMRAKKAASRVEEAELAQIIRAFDPKLMRL